MQEEEIQQIKRRFGIIGNAKALNRAVETAAQVAPTAMTVLITGESGSGKESFSKIIHYLSPNKHGKFIAINCGAIPEGTIDSELFGHTKGAFTGANEERKGYFEEADGGTIFLDEIGELPLGTQARLLRVLEYGEFIKVGASKVQKAQPRIVAATHVDLLEATYQGKFREDLYYRLNTVPLRIPPLRERGNDANFLFQKFATDFSEKYRVKPLQLTNEATEVLLAYRFPGNIRQLKNLVEQMSALETNRNITKSVLLTYLPPERKGPPALYQGQKQVHEQGVYERELLYKVLFEMKKDVQELKDLFFERLSASTQRDQLVKEHAARLSHLQHNDKVATTALQVINNPTPPSLPQPTEPTALSIEAQEKVLIAKALKKHQHRRKLAAETLGISERTLYRKIKQYDLE